MNYYRAMAKLPPIVEDPALSKGDLAHATYLVRNFRDKIEHGGGIGAEMHTENPANPGFTPEGLEAGKGSVVDVWYMSGNPSAGAHNRILTNGLRSARRVRRSGRSMDGCRSRSIARRYSILAWRAPVSEFTANRGLAPVASTWRTARNVVCRLALLLRQSNFHLTARRSR